MADIVMPRLSDTMEEGTILRWLKREGDEIRRGEELVEIETDKASMTYESDQDGVLELLAREGDTLVIGAVIARVGPRTTDGAGPRVAPAAPEVTPISSRLEPAARAAQASSQATPASSQATPASSEATPASSEAQASSEVVQAPPGVTPRGTAARVKASPLARRIAREEGVPLERLSGTGPGGRIVKADVEAARARSREPPTPAQRPARDVPTVGDVLSATGETSSRELSRSQQIIARRMAESKATIPHFTLQAEIDMDECVALRSEVAGHLRSSSASPQVGASTPAGKQGAAQAGSELAARLPSYNDMVVKACALALRQHPRVNGSYRDGRVQLHSRVNVGVAVAVESEDPFQGGLVVPTVFDADIKSLGEIARESRQLAERVRAGTITPPELSGGTFTVSNLGMYGVRRFAAIINPPQAAIISVGSLEARPVVRHGEIVARNTMAVDLACDHRMLYGADAARFLSRVRELLESPSALLL